MKKVLPLILFMLSGCAVAPAEPQVAYAPVYIEPAYVAPVVVEPVCCIFYGGIEGFWWHGEFYPRHYWRPHFRGEGAPYHFRPGHRRHR